MFYKLCWSALALLAVGCSTTVNLTTPTPREVDPIEGYWRFSDGLTMVMVEPCRANKEALCGLLIAFEGDPKARDYKTSDHAKWGQRRCRSTVFEITPNQERPGFYAGRVYAQNNGQTYAIEITDRLNGILEAHTFLNARLEEAVDMAIGASLGSAPSILDAGLFLARSVVGKELHSEVERWRRISIPHGRCDRPSIRPVGGPSQ